MLPGVGALDAADLAFDGFEAVQEQLADVGKQGGVARGDASLGDEGEKLAQDVVEVVGGLEFAGEGGEFGADEIGVADLTLLAGVVETESGVGLRAGHAALAAISEGEETAG
jgi:hypothetical protein